MRSQLVPAKSPGFLTWKQKQVSEIDLIVSKRKQILTFRCHTAFFKLVVKAKGIQWKFDQK